MERDNISREVASKKIGSQMPSKGKLEYADYVIDSSDTIQSTVEQTEKVFSNLMFDYRKKYGNQ